MAEQIFLKDFTKTILNKLVSYAAGEIKLVWGFKALVKRISKRFQMAQALLSDAENKQLERMETMQVWLKKLKAVACDAEDVFDEIAFEVLRRKLEIQNRRTSKVRNFFSLSNPLAFRLKMAHKVSSINSLLDEIYKEANEIGLKPVEFLNSTVQIREIRQTHPFVDDSEVVGRDGDVSIVVNMLLQYSDNEDHGLPIVAIVGMGGLGKTTLAQLVYKKQEVVGNFGERMWVCVSNDFNVVRLLKEMVQSVTGTTSEMSNIEALIKKLRDYINGRKYLLVLDDVWNQNQETWEQMRKALLGLGGARGSKIMVTTRSEVVVSTMQTSPSLTHHMVPLSENDGWTIFKKRAFANGGSQETIDLVAVGRRLVKRCGGLPLAIKALGALMDSKKNENEWLSIEKSEIWNSPRKINEVDVLPTIMLSFDHLPSPSLKQCFAYCATLPKDFRIVKDSLIQLWMAQGYLEPPQGSSSLAMEDIGNDYFQILLWNSFFQDVEKDDYEDIIGCTMHDQVHDFALYISKGSCLTIETEKVNDVSEVQHLSLFYGKGKIPELSKGNCSKLRTLILTSDLPGDMLRNFTCLHVLDLVGCQIEDLPRSIRKLIHLRYLDISWNPVKTLPNSISELYNLQTFRILNCLLIEALPKEFKNLVSLRHFNIDDNDKNRNLMPMGMGQLTCLQTLSFFVVGREKGRRIEELGRLTNLRGVVKIYNLENVTSKDEAEQTNLSSNSKIQELKFHWCSEREVDTNMDEGVLEGLKPHSNLKGLTIENFEGGTLPSWMKVTSHTPLLHGLVKLKLNNCKRLKHIPTLGHLPLLKVLSIKGIHNVNHIGYEFYGPNDLGDNSRTSFPSLAELTLSDMPNLVEWLDAIPPAGGTVFPSLEKLKIKGCSKLITIPYDFPSIKELVINGINSVALQKMSNTLTSLTSLVILKCSGPEINFVLKHFLVNNRSLLKELKIEECEALSCLPNELWGLMSLEVLEIFKCANLTFVPDIEETDNLTRLRQIWIVYCDQLCIFPSGLQNLPSLEALSMDGCTNLKRINEEEICSLTSLRALGFSFIAILRNSNCWPQWLLSLTGLEFLHIGEFSEELDYFPLPPPPPIASCSTSPSTSTSQQLPRHHQHLFVSLECLRLVGWPKLKSLPDQLQLFTSLTDLQIMNFDGLEALPDWLGNLSTLRSLQLFCCVNLRSLPSVEAMRRLTNLWLLYIDSCPLLKERCNRESGPEWHKIAHISLITIDDIRIQLR